MSVGYLLWMDTNNFDEVVGHRTLFPFHQSSLRTLLSVAQIGKLADAHHCGNSQSNQLSVLYMTVRS